MTLIKIVDWHIGREISGKSAVVGLWLMLVYIFLSLLDELEGDSDRSASLIAETLGYAVPRMIYELSPMILLIGTILALSLMSRHFELIALQASGVTKSRIVGSVVGFSACFAIGIFLWGEFVVPFTETKGSQVGSTDFADVPETTGNGIWIRNKNDFIHIDQIDKFGGISGVSIYQFDEQGRFKGQSYAHAGAITDDLNALRLLSTTNLQVKDNRMESRLNSSQELQFEFNQLKLVLETRNPAELNIMELYESVQLRKEIGLTNDFHELALWNRLIIPLSLLVMGMFAVLFTFRRRTAFSTGHFVLFGLLFGLFYFAMQQSVGYIAILNNMPPIIGTFSVFLFFLGYAFFALYRL